MKSISSKKSSRALYASVATVLIVLLGLSAYVYAYNGSLFGWRLRTQTAQQPGSTNYNPPTAEQKKAGSNVKLNTTSNPGSATKPGASGSPSDTPPAPTPQPNGKSLVNVSITSANQNGSMLQIRAVIDTVTSSGTCTLTLSGGGKTVTKTSGVQNLPSTSTCKGFDVATSELGSGTWTASLTFENSTLIGKTSKTIAVK